MKNVFILLGVVIFVLLLFTFFSPATDVLVEDAPVPTVPEPPSEDAPIAASEPEVEVMHADLLAVGPFSGQGAATRSFDGAVFLHTAEAELPSPPTGQSYEGWLVRGGPSDADFHFFSTGVMTNENEDGMWKLKYTAEQNYPEHNGVVITLETVVDAIPEAHVLEGSF